MKEGILKISFALALLITVAGTVSAWQYVLFMAPVDATGALILKKGGQ